MTFKTDWRFTCPRCSHMNTSEGTKCKNCYSTPILASFFKGQGYKFGCNNCGELNYNVMSCTQCGAKVANRLETKGLFGWRK